MFKAVEDPGELLRKQIELGKAASRLIESEDFKLVVKQAFLTDYAVELVEQANLIQSREVAVDTITGIATFPRWLTRVINEGESAQAQLDRATNPNKDDD